MKEPNKKSNLRHKLRMFWIQLEKASREKETLSIEEAREIYQEADSATEKLWPLYDARPDGALWLDRLIKQAKKWRVPQRGEAWKEPDLFQFFPR